MGGTSSGYLIDERSLQLAKRLRDTRQAIGFPQVGTVALWL